LWPEIGRGGKIEAEQRRHRPHPCRNRRLHRRPPHPQQQRRVGKADRTGGTQGGILAQRMPGDEGNPGHAQPFGLQRRKRRHRGCHQGRLGILRQGQLGKIAVPDQRRQPFVKRVIHRVEHRPRRWIGLGQRAPHADGLRPLPRKHECAAHGCPPPVLSRRNAGGRGLQPVATATALSASVGPEPVGIWQGCRRHPVFTGTTRQARFGCTPHEAPLAFARPPV